MITTLLTLYSAGLGSYWEDKTWFAYDGGVEIDRAGDYSTIYRAGKFEPRSWRMPFYLNQDGGVYLRLGSPPAFDVRVKPYPVTGGGVGIDVPSQTYNISDIVNEVVPGNGAFGLQRKSVSSQIIPKPLRSLSLIKRVRFLQRMD